MFFFFFSNSDLSRTSYVPSFVCLDDSTMFFSTSSLVLIMQSPVCLKQLALDLLERLLLSAFPELDDVVKQCHEKERFGELKKK